MEDPLIKTGVIKLMEYFSNNLEDIFGLGLANFLYKHRRLFS